MLYILNQQDFSIVRSDTTFLQFIPEIYEDKTIKEPYIFNQGDTVIFRIQLTKGPFEKYCIINTEDNSCYLVLEPDDTKDLDIRTYYYEVELITIYNVRQTFISGRLTLRKEIEKHGIH